MSNGISPEMLGKMSGQTSGGQTGARLGASAKAVMDAFRNRQGEGSVAAPFSNMPGASKDLSQMAQGNNFGAVQSMPAGTAPSGFFDPNARSVTQDVGGQPGFTPDGLNLPGTMAPPPIQIADPSTPIPQPDLAARQQVFNYQGFGGPIKKEDIPYLSGYDYDFNPEISAQNELRQRNPEMARTMEQGNGIGLYTRRRLDQPGGSYVNRERPPGAPAFDYFAGSPQGRPRGLL